MALNGMAWGQNVILGNLGLKCDFGNLGSKCNFGNFGVKCNFGSLGLVFWKFAI
jgi:hypothetical protein